MTSRSEARRRNVELAAQGQHWCPGCQQPLAIADFYIVRGRLTGRCKQCMLKASYERRQANPDYYKQYMERWHKRKKAEAKADPETWAAWREKRNAAQREYKLRKLIAACGPYRYQHMLATLLSALLSTIDAEEAAWIEQERAARLAQAAAEVAAVCEAFRERQRLLELVRQRHQMALVRLQREQPQKYQAYMHKLRQNAARRAQRSLAFKGMFNHD